MIRAVKNEFKSPTGTSIEGWAMGIVNSADKDPSIKNTPIYKTLAGWEKDISNIRDFNDLPQAAQDYIIFIEKFLECPIEIISVGPSRDQTIYRN